MADEVASEAVQLRKNVLIEQHFPHLAEIKDKILVVFKGNASSEGNVIDWGHTKKMPKIANTIAKHCGTELEWIFQIELSSKIWDDLGDMDQKCLLIHHLCVMGMRENEASGEKRYFKIPPEIKYYRLEVELCDYWRSIKDRIGEKGKLPGVQMLLFNQEKARKAEVEAQAEEEPSGDIVLEQIDKNPEVEAV